MISSRRQFERLLLSEEALAMDEAGRTLGTVSSAGGGGMTIKLACELKNFDSGQRLRITVEEPSTGIRHTVPVEVKYCLDGNLGVQFVSSL